MYVCWASEALNSYILLKRLIGKVTSLKSKIRFFLSCVSNPVVPGYIFRRTWKIKYHNSSTVSLKSQYKAAWSYAWTTFFFCDKIRFSKYLPICDDIIY